MPGIASLAGAAGCAIALALQRAVKTASAIRFDFIVSPVKRAVAKLLLSANA
jgi:hypothetical protein